MSTTNYQNAKWEAERDVEREHGKVDIIYSITMGGTQKRRDAIYIAPAGSVYSEHFEDMADNHNKALRDPNEVLTLKLQRQDAEWLARRFLSSGHYPDAFARLDNEFSKKLGYPVRGLKGR